MLTRSAVWRFGLVAVLGCTASLAFDANAKRPKGPMKFSKVGGTGPDLLAKFVTSHGVIRCQLFPRRAKKTVKNFVGLAVGTKAFKDARTKKRVKRRFYDGLIFHRVIPKFMIQTGCPEGTGSGGPGYAIRDEFSSKLRHDRAGMLSMANRGPNTGGSQFFITERETPWLDDKHAVFGVCKDLKVIKGIARVPVVPPSRPREPVRIEKVEISWGKW